MTTTPNLPVLPEDTAEQLVALRDTKPEFYAFVKALRLNGWPLRAIASPFDVSRTAVSDWEKSYNPVTALPSVPKAPEPPSKEVRKPKKPPVLSDEEIRNLRQLADLASTVRRHTDPKAPSRRAAVELEAKLIDYDERGISRTQLGKYCGVSRSSIQQRLSKYGK